MFFAEPYIILKAKINRIYVIKAFGHVGVDRMSKHLTALLSLFIHILPNRSEYGIINVILVTMNSWSVLMTTPFAYF